MNENNKDEVYVVPEVVHKALLEFAMDIMNASLNAKGDQAVFKSFLEPIYLILLRKVNVTPKEEIKKD